jgi:phosphotriesterase-related protein
VIVRTVRGDRTPDGLGWTLGHEHLVARPPKIVTDDDLRLDDEEAAARELTSFREAGGGAVVEMTTVDYGRDAAALARLSERSGVDVIAATGFNKGRFADGIVGRHSDEALVAWMVGEVRFGALPYAPPETITLTEPGLREGPDGARTPRAGLIKASTGAGGPSEGERRSLQAAIAAHHATGAPIGTHTEKADWALEQAQAFRDGGVPPDKVLIGHLDFRPEVLFLLEVASAGVCLGLDQFSKEKYLADEDRVDLVVALASEGHLAQLVLSGDLARRSYWPGYGHEHAPGFAHLPRTIAPMLRAEGLSDEDLRTLFIDNPRRWLAFEPR